MEEKDLIMDIENRKETKVLPLVALRGKVLFPGTYLNFFAGQ